MSVGGASEVPDLHHAATAALLRTWRGEIIGLERFHLRRIQDPAAPGASARTDAAPEEPAAGSGDEGEDADADDDGMAADA